jgi:hypothetical protein
VLVSIEEATAQRQLVKQHLEQYEFGTACSRAGVGWLASWLAVLARACCSLVYVLAGQDVLALE